MLRRNPRTWSADDGVLIVVRKRRKPSRRSHRTFEHRPRATSFSRWLRRGGTQAIIAFGSDAEIVSRSGICERARHRLAPTRLGMMFACIRGYRRISCLGARMAKLYDSSPSLTSSAPVSFDRLARHTRAYSPRLIASANHPAAVTPTTTDRAVTRWRPGSVLRAGALKQREIRGCRLQVSARRLLRENEALLSLNSRAAIGPAPD